MLILLFYKICLAGNKIEKKKMDGTNSTNVILSRFGAERLSGKGLSLPMLLVRTHYILHCSLVSKLHV